MLPFKVGSIAKQKVANNWSVFNALMKAGCGLTAIEDPEKAKYYDPIKVVVVDSFTRCLYLLSQALKQANIKGYDFWRDYGDTIEKLLMEWQSRGRFIIFTALDEVIRDNDSIDRKVIKVEGKKLEGMIESFFSIVLHTHFNPLKTGAESYMFCTNTDGRNTAKSPYGMFPERYIQNNMAYILGSIYRYYDMANNPDFQPSPIVIVGKSGTGKSSSFRYLFEE